MKTAVEYMGSRLTYLSKTFAPTRPNLKPSAGHQTCEPCNGLGFMRAGEFGIDRKFVKCEWCKGLGQKYLES